MIAQSNAAIIAQEDAHTPGFYPKRPIAVVRGQGALVWDADGKEYIDCVAGQGAANLGHAHPAVVAAIKQQAETLISCTEVFYNDQRAAYLSELIAALPVGMERAFLCNSGAEAIEGALKIARLYTGRQKVIAAVRGFHGRTMGALSATYEPKYREPFAPLLEGFSHVPYNKLDLLANAVTQETAAVLIEPLQAEGGVHVAAADYLKGALEICHEHGALLIVDEIQTGFGRTGRMFAVEHAGITPDLMALAKSIAGGIPMGAVAIHSRLGTLPQGTHGSTFGGNPFASAVARAALRAILEEDLPRQAAEKGAYIVEKLRALKRAKVREVRGQGLLIGLELKERVQPHLVALMEHGVLTLPAGPNVLRLLPPLVISYEQLDRVIEAINAVLA